MFTIDFTKPWLYKDIIYFNQGNLSTNNTLRCKLVTGGSDDFTGGSIACTFTTKDSIEISGFGRLVDAKGGIVDIVFPSNALVVGTNKLEILVNRADGGVAQSPSVLYDIWQGLTTGNGVEAETNYPILIELINSTNEASNKANLALNKANSMITDITEATDNAYRSANEADIATSNANTKIEEVETAQIEMIKQVDNSIANMKFETNTAINSITSKTDEKITDVNKALASGTKDLEVKESRRDMDGVEHATLKIRLESDLKKGKVIEETKEGTYLSFNDTIGGLVSYLEVLGNTVQDISNLSNIRSSCVPNGDGTFKMSILSCGENLFNKYVANNGFIVDMNTGNLVPNANSSTGFIKVNPNLSYSWSNRNSGGYAEYDANKKFIRYLSTLGGEISNHKFSPDAIFVRMNVGTDKLNDFTMVIGSTAPISYITYEETKCDIKLPCQLEKWDKLCFDKDENAWVVDKGTLHKKFNGSEGFRETGKLANTSRFNCPLSVFDGIINQEIAINNKLPFIKNYELDSPHFYYDSTGISIFIPNSELVGTNVSEWLVKNSFEVIYVTSNRQKIVLPQSDQIKLNSFANKTHIYTISGEVDATVKATVSKSLASTVQANTEEIGKINNTIADMQGLKESQDFAYETDRGYLVCKDTKNGVVKDLKIGGKSLVQVYPQLPISEQNYIYNVGLNGVSKDGDYITLTGNGTHYIDCAIRFSKNELFKPSTEYTFFIEIVSNTVKGALLYNTEYLNRSMFSSNSIFSVNEGFTGIKIVKATTKDSAWFNDNTIDNKTILRTQLTPNNIGSVKYRIWALEGSYDEVVPFFKGIASVGNGNEIEVLSRNKNIAKEIVAGTINTTTGEYMDNSNVNRLNKVRILPNTKYTFSKNNTPRACNKYFYDKDNKFIGTINGVDSTFITPTNAYYISLTWGTIIEDGDYQLEMGGTVTSYVKPFEDKKPILFKDVDGAWKPITELRGINLNICDNIENGVFNKLLSLETVSDKNTFTLRSQDGGTLTNCFEVNEPLTNCNVSDTNFIGLCDKFKTYNWTGVNGLVSSDVEGVTILSNKKIRFRILKSKANSVEELKSYLINNNFNILRLLENKLTYEVNPLDLQSFENETMISFGSTVIDPYASWKITSSLPNFVKELSNQIKQLQYQVYKTNVANFTVALNTLDTKLRLDRLEAPQQ